MFTKENYKLLGKVTFLNKSTESESEYYKVSFGGVTCKVRVSSHYNERWKGDVQIVTSRPDKITKSDIKGRCYEYMMKKYTVKLSKHRKKKKRKKK